ncbi:heme exporter protein CcmB [Pasteurellaceae bacterium HPA106]|uniref:heme exporter protein CcmB n=1 Tax=Spirabiliibacterium pneumoniae TaxID=221400 RepID=UPI001AAD6337|nr:heme exporter protein CcmB [Spirabiliibacterium pneumoniae]MBE2897188.1 heme exporter protein CcmB [Spirabiliibacterium pneumoniae]
MIFSAILKRELQLAWLNKSALLNPLWFFLMVVSLFPLVVGPEPSLLARIAPGVVWVATLFSALLAFERLFADDFRDGSLEQLTLLRAPLSLTMAAKMLAHWIITALPLILLSPLAALLLSLDVTLWWALLLTLLLGTPTLSAIGAIGVALTVGLRRGGVLLSLLVIPLIIPVLIFSAAVLDAAQLQLDYTPQLAILGAIMMLTITLAPFAIAGAVKIHLE